MGAEALDVGNTPEHLPGQAQELLSNKKFCQDLDKAVRDVCEPEECPRIYPKLPEDGVIDPESTLGKKINTFFDKHGISDAQDQVIIIEAFMKAIQEKKRLENAHQWTKYGMNASQS